MLGRGAQGQVCRGELKAGDHSRAMHKAAGPQRIQHPLLQTAKEARRCWGVGNRGRWVEGRACPAYSELSRVLQGGREGGSGEAEKGVHSTR